MPDFDDWDDERVIPVRADLGEFRRDLDEVTRLSDGMGRALTRAFDRAVVRGNDLSDVLRQLGLRLSRLALDAALRPLEEGIGQAVSGALGDIVPFARGGVVGQPTLFPLNQGLGVAGEAGPEAILPLRRGPDGRLGVGAGDHQRPVQITFNVSTPDARSFLGSEGQIHAMLARAAERGRRNL